MSGVHLEICKRPFQEGVKKLKLIMGIFFLLLLCFLQDLCGLEKLTMKFD